MPKFASGDNGESTANQTGGLGGSAGYSIVISADGVGTTIDNVSGFGVEIGSRVTSTSPT